MKNSPVTRVFIVFFILLSSHNLFSESFSESVLDLSLDVINIIRLADESVAIVADEFTKEKIFGFSKETSFGMVTNDGSRKEILVRLDIELPDHIKAFVNIDSNIPWIEKTTLELTTAYQTLVSNIPPFSNEGEVGIVFEVQAPRMTRPNQNALIRKVSFVLKDAI